MCVTLSSTVVPFAKLRVYLSTKRTRCKHGGEGARCISSMLAGCPCTLHHLTVPKTRSCISFNLLRNTHFTLVSLR